jgi:2-hydroxy-3-oxopropionate reductase
MTKAPKVSLLGLGKMGQPIADRLLDTYGELTVWNRTPSKASPLVARGAHSAETPAMAAAEVTLTVLTDLSDVQEILSGPDGLIGGWRRLGISEPVLVIHGTVSPTAVAELAAELAKEGIGVVDAPLSGGVAGAETGNLSIMVGGDDWAVAKAMPVLENVGSTIVHFGPPGAGETAKACNQVIVAGTVTAIAESLVFADAAGLDRAKLLRILGGGLAASEVLRQKQDRWLNADFTGGGSAVNQLKDLRFASDTAASKGMELPLTLLLREIFDRMVSEGRGELDHSAVELTIADASRSGRTPR